MVLQRIVKPRTQRAKRALEKREPKLTENTKTAMFIRGGRTSELVSNALKDLYSLKKPDAVLMKRKNILRPFEDQTSLEFLSEKNDASLFMFGSHSKKRPNNLVLGRMYDHHILDMIELGIEKYVPVEAYQGFKVALGSKPCLIFSGESFDSNVEHQRMKNMFIDFFRGPVVEKVRLAGLEHVITFTAADGRIFVRCYRIVLKKSGSRIPRVELEEIGPSFDLVMRRTHLASDDLYKRARKVPKQTKPKKVKNVSVDPFGTKHGRIHMQKQDLNKLQTRKMKALKRKVDTSSENNENSQSKKNKKPTAQSD